MTDRGAKHCVIGLASVFFEVGQRVPGPVQQILSPALDELLLEVGDCRRRGPRARGVRESSETTAACAGRWSLIRF